MRRILMAVLLLAGCSGPAASPDASSTDAGYVQVDASMDELCNLDVCMPSELPQCEEMWDRLHADKDWDTLCPTVRLDYIWCSQREAEEGVCPFDNSDDSECFDLFLRFVECDTYDGGV